MFTVFHRELVRVNNILFSASPLRYRRIWLRMLASLRIPIEPQLSMLMGSTGYLIWIEMNLISLYPRDSQRQLQDVMCFRYTSYLLGGENSQNTSLDKVFMKIVTLRNIAIHVFSQRYLDSGEMPVISRSGAVLGSIIRWGRFGYTVCLIGSTGTGKVTSSKEPTRTDHWCPTVTGKEWLAWPCAIQFAQCKPAQLALIRSSSFSEGNAASERGEPERKRWVYTAQSIDKAAKVAANLPNRVCCLSWLEKRSLCGLGHLTCWTDAVDSLGGQTNLLVGIVKGA